MTKLNQIIAIEKGVRNKTQRELTEIYHKIQKSVLWSGMNRVYARRDDEQGEVLPPETMLVQVRAGEVLRAVEDATTRLFDVVAEKDITNMGAKADVVVDGTTVIQDVPVTYLLFLEKQLTDLHTVLGRIPTLDPAEKWTFNSNTGVYETPTVQTIRTKKVPRNHVKAPATDKHPAQVEVYFEDTQVGTWNTTKFSGAWSQEERSTVLNRVEQLQKAVKFAREEANTTEVTYNATVGRKVFDFILRSE